MGQKTNPNIFRLGKTKDWTSKYFEKKPTEASIYSFKNLEIKKFIHKFFKDNGLMLHNCKVYYLNENSLYIFFSYYLTFNSTTRINLLTKKQKIKFTRKKIKVKKSKKYLIVRKNIKNYANYQEDNYLFNTLPTALPKLNFLKAYRAKKLEQNSLKIRRLYFLKAYKKYLIIKNKKNIKTIETNNFLSKFFESLHLFINKKINIFLTIHQLNKNLKQNLGIKKIEVLKPNFVNLKKYEGNTFFKDGVNVIVNCATNENSAKLLAQFIAIQLAKMKRHNFFLRFIKTALLICKKSTLSKIKGIKIKINGRFNGALRARRKKINIGRGVPNVTIDANIDYSEETSYTSKGTFGVKVWMVYKNNLC